MRNGGEGGRRGHWSRTGGASDVELAAHLDEVDPLLVPAPEARLVKVGRSTVVEEGERGREGGQGRRPGRGLAARRVA